MRRVARRAAIDEMSGGATTCPFAFADELVSGTELMFEQPICRLGVIIFCNLFGEPPPTSLVRAERHGHFT